MKRNFKLYWTLFSSTFYLSAFTFGGGFVIIPLMKKKFVDDRKWIEDEEMLDLIAIAQSSPGAIAVNASIIMGYRIGGILGSLIATIGTVLPPLIIVSVISFFYSYFRDNIYVSALLKGMQSGVAAVIIDVVLKMAGGIVKEKRIISIVMMIGAFVATFFFKVNVAYIILICGAIGAFLTLREEKIGRKVK